MVCFEPVNCDYVANFELLKINLRGVPLKVPAERKNFEFDMDEFKAAFSSKTRLLILENPNRYTGKVFSNEELESIFGFLDKEHTSVRVITSEVYNLPLLNSPSFNVVSPVKNNLNKTISLYSAGEVYNCSGWKIGWAIGSAELIKRAAVISSAIYYSISQPSQVAFGRALEQLDSKENDQEGMIWLEALKKDLCLQRETLVKEVTKAGLVPVHNHAGFNLVVDVSGIKEKVPQKYTESNEYESVVRKEDNSIPLDVAVSKYLQEEKKILLTPLSICYSKKNKQLAENLVASSYASDC